MNHERFRQMLEAQAAMDRRTAAARKRRWLDQVEERSKPAPLVMGSIRGLRAFRLEPVERPGVGRADRLWPLTSNVVGPWKPGWNEAVCPHRCSEPPTDRASLRDLQMMILLGAVPPSPPALAATVAMDCSCGFHAFTDPDEMTSQVPRSDPSLVTGVVEGAGTTVEADLGFRSKRARLVALVAQRPRLRSVAWSWIALVICLAAIASCLSSTLDGWDGLSWMNLGLAALNAVCAWINGRRLWRLYGSSRSVRKRAQAFGVPVFRSQDEAVAAFPLGLTGPESGSS